MRILVTFAVETEFAAWRKLCDLEETRISDLPVFRARVGTAKVDFAITGMGAENAFRVTKKLLAEPFQACLTCGFAGALKANHAVGQVLVADAVQELGKAKTLACARDLVHAAENDGATRVGMFLTSDHVVRTTEEKKSLAAFADAVEMESFGALRAAAALGKSAVAIRVISDGVGNDMPAVVDTALDDMGQIRIAGVVRYVSRHPLQLPALIRLGRDSKTAARALARFLEGFIKRLSFTTHGAMPSEFQETAVR